MVDNLGRVKGSILSLVSSIGGGITVYALNGSYWQAGLLALAIYGTLLGGDFLWARRHDSPDSRG